MTRRLVLWGAGGHAKVVADVARAAGWTVVGLVDRKRERVGQIGEPGGAKVMYEESEFLAALSDSSRTFDAAAVAFGANRARLDAVRLLQQHLEVPVIVHPSALLSSSCALGAGSVVMPGVIVNAATLVGEGTILNTACVIEHDCILEDGVHVSPHATLTGGVRVGALSWVGAGAVVLPTVAIGKEVRVGAGAVVIRDVPDNLTVFGCPAVATGSSASH